MPEYVKKALDRLQHPNPKVPQYAPHLWTFPAYGNRIHMAPYTENINIIEKNSAKRIESIVGKIIYYARSVNPKILREIDEIPQVQ